ncbi:LysE family transporter [Thaumasiovibrio sp. DFM-14]|uniref:LysE family transporter n=1 Tax=Thaumasiovibrio sp. DFM-14 TaxID=3384792 RepID=UPI00399FF83E
MTLSIWLTFVAACVVFSFAPGAGMVATISNTLSSGISTAMKNIVGLQLALMVHLLIVSLGLGALLASSAVAFTAVKYCGAAYLVYLGIVKIFSKSELENDEVTVNTDTSIEIVKQGFLVNLMNPKSIIFLAAFLPQFISSDIAATQQYIILGLTVLVIDCLVMVFYASLARSVKRFFQSPSMVKLQNRIFGVTFVAMGAILASAEH